MDNYGNEGKKSKSGKQRRGTDRVKRKGKRRIRKPKTKELKDLQKKFEVATRELLK